MDNTISHIRQKYELLRPTLTEAGRRRWAAAEAIGLGRGGTERVHAATGIARHTIRAGIRELQGNKPLPDPGKQRLSGSGRKRISVSQPGIVAALDALVDPITRGDPMCPLRWTTKSTAKLAEQLVSQGFKVTAPTVARLLREQGYSLQSTRKVKEGAQHPDRDSQFQYIHDCIIEEQRHGRPVISVDAKKKELVGDFHQAGREWQPQGMPVEVRTHDFVDPELGKAAPYGVFDISRNEGWVSVGTSADTSEFAVSSIRRWWFEMGRPAYGPDPVQLTITADGGGSNGSRVRAWKASLQALANELQIPIVVHHLPPGTSKWNKIEHRLFASITINWRGRPLESVAAIVELIRNTTNRGGLKVRAAKDENVYEKGVKVTDEEFAAINIMRHETNPQWNYTIFPNRSRNSN